MITVLSLNLRGDDWVNTRMERLQPVVGLCRSEDVDLLFLQEGMSGWLVMDTIRYLKKQLYLPVYTKAPVFGFWPFKLFNVGIISLWPFLMTGKAPCSIKSKECIDNLPIPGKCRVVKGQIGILGIGVVNVYSAHLASSPLSEIERQKQVRCMMDFINAGRTDEIKMEILGADLNFGTRNPAFKLITDAGFQQCGIGGDRIFVRGGQIKESKIVFQDRFVSDHCGILARIGV